MVTIVPSFYCRLLSSFLTEVLGLVADSVLKLRFSALCGPN